MSEERAPSDDAAERGSSDKAGPESPHLDEGDRSLAAQHAAPRALVIHEIVREEGEDELRRRPAAMAFSGFAAGLSVGFSFLMLSILQSHLPAAPWRPLLDSVGYTVGFLIVVLGRQELFTESTLTAVLPLLMRRDRATLMALLRFWGVVLSCNLLGTLVFAALVTPTGLFSESIHRSMIEVGRGAVSEPFAPTLLKAVLAGWLIALMIWLLPSARSARMFVILFLSYVVGVGRFSHVIAGSVEAAFLVFSGHGTVGEYVGKFFVPTLIGNTIGGVALVALLNHAPLVPDLHPDGGKRDNGER